METVVKAVGAVVLLIGLIIGLSLLAAWPTMLLINYLIVPSLLIKIFGIPSLTFWKAFWLNFLTGILFRSSSTSSSK